VTVYCEAESHEPWQRIYTRDEEGVWVPDLFDYFGEPDPLNDYLGDRVRKARRDGGMEFLDAATEKPLRVFDSGRSLADAADRIEPAMEGVIVVRRRYVIRCPGCRESLPRTEANLARQFDSLVSQGINRVTIPMLRGRTRGDDELSGR
jgi:hypothetical protein